MKRILMVVGLFFCFFVMAACTADNLEEISLRDEAVDLTIAVKNPSMIQDYLEAFAVYFPNWTIEVLSEGMSLLPTGTDLDEWLEENQADLVMIDTPETYRSLMENGQLTALDSLILGSTYDVDKLVPAVLEWQRMQNADNRLYALPTGFYSRVLLYNRELFDQMNIPFPEEQITWSEVLQLAQHFRYDENQLYGLQADFNIGNRGFGLIQQIANADNLLLFDVATNEVFANTLPWKEIWEQVLQAYEAQSISPGMQSNPSDTAIMIGRGIREYTELTRNADFRDKWGVSFFPISAEDNRGYIQISHQFGIHAESPRQEYAWEALQFFASEEMTRFKHEGFPYIIHSLPVHQSWTERVDGDMEKFFFEIDPRPDILLPVDQDSSRARSLGNLLFEQVQNDELELDEALDQFQQELEELLHNRE